MLYPPTRTVLVLLLSIDLLIWVLAVTLGHTPASWMGEGKPITWVSGAHLVLATVLAGLTFTARQRKEDPGQKDRPFQGSYWLWFFITFGFAFLTVDELAQFHENLDKWIHRILSIQQTRLTD